MNPSRVKFWHRIPSRSRSNCDCALPTSVLNGSQYAPYLSPCRSSSVLMGMMFTSSAWMAYGACYSICVGELIRNSLDDLFYRLTFSTRPNWAASPSAIIKNMGGRCPFLFPLPQWFSRNIMGPLPGVRFRHGGRPQIRILGVAARSSLRSRKIARRSVSNVTQNGPRSGKILSV